MLLQMRFVPLQGAVRRCTALAVTCSGKYIAVAEELLPSGIQVAGSAPQLLGAAPEPPQHQAGGDTAQ